MDDLLEISPGQAANILAKAGYRVSSNGAGAQAHEPTEQWPKTLDWPALLRDGIPPVEMLLDPYMPARARVLVVGPTGSGKSMWAAWVGTVLSRRGLRICYFSEENPQQEELRRLAKLQPDPEFFRLYHWQGIDLSRPEHIAAVRRECTGAALAVFDTLSSIRSGDENDNPAYAAFDRDVLMPLVARGTAPMVLDHSGHPQAFVRRRGVHAPRGASAKAQKSDVVLEFIPGKAAGEFRIECPKMRPGGVLPNPTDCRVVDAEDGAIAIIGTTTDPAADRQSKVEAAADAMVGVLEARGPMATKALHEAMRGRAGREISEEAMTLLASEHPPRVIVGWQEIETDGHKTRAKVWRSAELLL